MARASRAKGGPRQLATPKAAAESRSTLIRDVEAQWCALSAAMALFQTRSAAERGLTLTDLQAVDLLEREGGVCAGRLAEQCGLTPGAITGMLNRLERAGVARRTRNSHDARRLVIRTVKDRPCRECRVPQAFRQVAASFDDDSLRAIRRFLSASAEALQRDAARKPPDEAPRPGGRRPRAT
ncbi:MAG: MarR family winged helix-turn-helix transcriptional regulator [Vicinamibacterales bacterium]